MDLSVWLMTKPMFTYTIVFLTKHLTSYLMLLYNDNIERKKNRCEYN